VQVLERQTLVDVTGGDGRPAAVSDTAFARIAHDYPPDLLAEIHAQSMQLRQSARSRGRRLLGLDHLRRVQETIPQVKELVHDRQRLDELSDIAGVELEPYPIGTSCSGINFYWPGQQPIEFHCDGPAFVELVPLYVDGHQEGGSTVAFRGPPDAGRLLAQDRIPDEQLLRIPNASARASCCKDACSSTPPKRSPTGIGSPL